MHQVLIVAIIFGGIIIALAIIPVTILFAIKLIKGRVQGNDRLKRRIQRMEDVVTDKEFDWDERFNARHR